MIILLTFLIVLFILEGISANSSCPEKYRKIIKDHTFCKPANPKCKFVTRGLQNKKSEIQQILDLHNNFRNKVATGKESGASDGKLPPASNMLEMMWDEEFAQIAQKWADQCQYKVKHDKAKQRTTESLSAGQNLLAKWYSCSGKNCKGKQADWKSVVENLYSEVKYFNKGIIKSYKRNSGKTFRHFTQIIWAKSYKVGCGFVAFNGKKGTKQVYICNYGPAGNVIKTPVYIEGPACSKCPKNSSCDKAKYAGLCRMK